MNKSMSICNHVGCNVLLKSKGYCENHKKQQFKELDNKKTDRQKKFYSSYAWTKTSLLHRKLNPLCSHCKANGIIAPGELVHHNPDLNYLWDNNLNPLDNKYLETLCFNCHQKELNNKKNVPRGTF